MQKRIIMKGVIRYRYVTSSRNRQPDCLPKDLLLWTIFNSLASQPAGIHSNTVGCLILVFRRKVNLHFETTAKIPCSKKMFFFFTFSHYKSKLNVQNLLLTSKRRFWKIQFFYIITQSISVFWYLRFENLAAYLTLKGLTAVTATDMNLREKK